LRSAFFFLLVPTILQALSCTPPGPEGGDSSVISRDAFIQAYVDLRVAALRSPGMELPLEERDRILVDLGLVDQDLLDFVEVRGRDIQFMRRVWEEIDSIITEKREITRSANPRGT